jgi:subtilisin-like proprotein convertase family protein
MLQANPNLNWRDVQHILIETAEKNDPYDPDWTTNGAGYDINYKYGFGRIDAQAAVSASKSWDSLGEISVLDTSSPNIPIPDGDGTSVTDTIYISDDFPVEFVEIYFSAADHTWWGDLEITLISPEGTESVLAEQELLIDSEYNRWDNWRFGSLRSFGESSKGTWTLKVKDMLSDYTGTFQSWTLKVFGSKNADSKPKSKAMPWIPLLLLDDGGGGEETIQNGNFESGSTAWTEYFTGGIDIIRTSFPGTVAPHSGSYAAWLGGVYDATRYIRQTVAVPSSSPTLTFYHWIASAESGCNYDLAYVRVNGSNKDTLGLCSSNNTGGWVPRSINLSGYAGQNISLEFRSVTNSTLNSNWFIDDVSFQ